MSFCSYYIATINKPLTWFFVATFRSNEHLAFDRTLNVDEGIFEFFVPQDLEEEFIKIMKYYEQKKIIFNLTKPENRIKQESQDE